MKNQNFKRMDEVKKLVAIILKIWLAAAAIGAATIIVLLIKKMITGSI